MGSDNATKRPVGNGVRKSAGFRIRSPFMVGHAADVLPPFGRFTSCETTRAIDERAALKNLEVAELVWSDWFPLPAARRSFVVSATAGLYRIREPGADVWDYVGQTGDSLRRRFVCAVRRLR